MAVTVSALRIGEVAKERNPGVKVDDGLGILEARMKVRIEVDIFEAMDGAGRGRETNGEN